MLRDLRKRQQRMTDHDLRNVHVRKVPVHQKCAGPTALGGRGGLIIGNEGECVGVGVVQTGQGGHMDSAVPVQLATHHRVDFSKTNRTGGARRGHVGHRFFFAGLGLAEPGFTERFLAGCAEVRRPST